MKSETYFEQILQTYPPVLSKEQMFKICKISKKTCLYLLTSGLVPCIDNRKRTHRFQIKTIDVVAYLRDREIHPGKYSPADGYYIDKTRKNHVYPYGRITETSLAIGREYFANLLSDFPDVLSPTQVSEFTGYNKTTVNNWCSKQYLRCFLIRNRYHIPKEYLLDFLISKHFYGIRFKSEKHMAYNEMLAEYFNKKMRTRESE